jgi:thioredoxin-like negative regulator of GroEL
LFATSKEKLYRFPGRCQFAQAFFYWLDETRQLKLYLENARAKGYDLEVLEETTASSWGKINKELAAFIEENACAGAHLHDARQAEGHAQKEQAFLKALQLKPDHHAARLELARCYNHTGDYESCRKHLNQILNDPESAEFLQAATLMANTYYKQKDYTNALEYYSKAWEYAACYEYKYKVAYRIGHCYEHLENPQCAAQAYKNYLNYNWEPDKNKEATDRARQYLEYTDPIQIKQADCQEEY